MLSINPYLNFNGNCELAFLHYKSVFGNDYVMMSRFKDAPSENLSAEYAEKILHVSLPIGGGSILMGSDVPAGYGNIPIGENISISINATSVQEADTLFNGLAKGGKVKMPMEKTFWGAYFGMLTDAYGINWMVNLDFE